MSATLLSHSGPWLDSLKGLFFPPACLLCNRFIRLSAREFVCTPCSTNLSLQKNPGFTDISNDSTDLVSSTGRVSWDGSAGAAGPADLDGVFFLYRYGTAARKLVHRLKMTGDIRGGAWLESQLRLLPALSDTRHDLVVPVPSHRRHSLLNPDLGGTSVWADALGAFFKTPVRRSLARTRTIPKQTSLGRDRRLATSDDSLAARLPLLKNVKSVLLADDVMTTGATARACARVLKRAGVRHVTLAVIARG